MNPSKGVISVVQTDDRFLPLCRATGIFFRWALSGRLFFFQALIVERHQNSSREKKKLTLLLVPESQQDSNSAIWEEKHLNCHHCQHLHCFITAQ